MTARRLLPADVAATLDRLRTAQRAASRVPRAERITALGRLAETWERDDSLLRETAAETAESTGYAVDMVHESLRRTLRAWATEPLRDLVEEALAPTQGTPLCSKLIVTLLAQNTPGLAVAPTFSALALGSAVLIKCARGEDRFAPRLVERLRALHPTLGAACEAVVWPGGAALEVELFAEADRIIAYGPQAVLDRAHALAGSRVVARGPRVSVAVVGPAPSDLGDVARRLARDVAFLDQRGCLSPQAILVDAGIDRGALGRALAHELEALESVWPRRALSDEEAAVFRRAVEADEARTLRGEPIELLGGVGRPWAVVVEDGRTVTPSPLDRFVRLHPFDDATGLETALGPLRHHLECVGLVGETQELVSASHRSGAARVTQIGAMQDPPASWAVGGAPPLTELLSWSRSELPGEEASDGSRRERFLRHVAQTSDAPRGIDVARARGSWVYDRSGRRYLDLLAGIGVASIGHAHPRVAAAVAAQSRRYTHVMVYGEDLLEPQIELTSRLADRLPPSLSNAYLTNSGAEAIEGAIKLVRKATGRDRILAFEGAYHGDTTGAMALGGNPFYREPFRPLVEPVDHLPWEDTKALDRIDHTTAAVFVEPVQAEAGVRIPSPHFLPALVRRCRAVGALVVFDEVVTALGRTGRWFGFEHWPEALPDVLVLAKSLGGGLPLGAFIASPELQSVLSADPPLGHVTTFGGNPVCCAAGLAALEVLADRDLPTRAADVGAGFHQSLTERIGVGGLTQVRGIGLLLGLEFDHPERTVAFADACRKGGVLLGWTLHDDRVVRLAPPLTLEKHEIDFALEVIDRALRSASGDR